MPDATRLSRGLSAFGSVALAFVPALALAFWLVSVSFEFMGVFLSGEFPSREGASYALRISLAILLPPALVAATEENTPLRPRLAEAGRAALFALFVHTLGFFLIGWLVRLLTGSMSPIILPRLMWAAAPGFSCVMLFLSFRFALWLLPRRPQTLPAPEAMKTFGFLAPWPVVLFFLSVSLPASLLGPHPRPGDVSLPVFLLITLAWGLRFRGWRMFRLPYLAVCLFLALRPLSWPADFSALRMLFHLVQTALSLAACALLFRPEVKRWLV